MYYLIKCIQAAGLTFTLIAFAKEFPEIIDMKMLGAGICVFTFGWVLQMAVLKK